jgi:hypothetical protein
MLFLVLLVLSNFPILSIMQNDILIGHIPLKIVLTFVIWITIILLSGYIINRK